MIRKAIIPAAGLGTRLLPVTKEMPKEMLPIFFRTKDGEIGFEPMIQAVFESLHNYGCRDYCIVVGRGKRVLEDHFTPDYEFARHLRSKSTRMADDLQGFYDRIERSTIVFMNQPRPKGFGHAVQLARAFVEDEPFIVHAGDDTILGCLGAPVAPVSDGSYVGINNDCYLRPAFCRSIAATVMSASSPISSPKKSFGQSLMLP